MNNANTEQTKYALAYDLKGFRSSILRVRIIRETADYIWVRTADIQDVGTVLVLNPSQIRDRHN